ncbi:EIF2AK4 [Mytilus edulis]|uniref:EIF2AK4 n=1 Tax=Mytilus edulis TaxID=6550 RepID=A0A8S3S0H8_MYTED|nr:EIF2AK4 [Mytilus edulis]
MADDSLLQRQEEEWQVLQAVYMDDVVDLRKKVAWKVERPLHICLILKQQQSESVAGTTDSDSMIHMVIKCPNKYPDLVPEISLENSKGLSNEQIAVLNTELIERAKSMVGEVMVLELAQHVQTFLRDNYKGPQKSFYEEMLSNQLKQQEKLKIRTTKRLDFLKRKEEKERQLLEDEIQKRQHALKEETKKIKETKQISDEKPTEQEKAVPATPITEVPTCSPIGTPSTPRRPRMSHSPSPLIVLPSNENKYNQDKRRRRTSTPLRDTDDSDHQCKDHTGGIVVIAFNTKSERTIHRGTCLGHSVHGSTVYAGIDTASGELVAISEWVLKWRHIKQKRTQRVDYEDKEGATYLKQVMSRSPEKFFKNKLQMLENIFDKNSAVLNDIVAYYKSLGSFLGYGARDMLRQRGINTDRNMSRWTNFSNPEESQKRREIVQMIEQFRNLFADQKIDEAEKVLHSIEDTGVKILSSYVIRVALRIYSLYRKNLLLSLKYLTILETDFPESQYWNELLMTCGLLIKAGQFEGKFHC